MSLADRKWWQRVFHKSAERKVDALNDIAAMKECLSELHMDVKAILKELTELEELEKERMVAKSGIVHVNLETQVRVFDILLERYEFFENDVDINGLRLKRIAGEYLKHAQRAGLTDLVAEKKENAKWHFLW